VEKGGYYENSNDVLLICCFSHVGCIDPLGYLLVHMRRDLEYKPSCTRPNLSLSVEFYLYLSLGVFQLQISLVFTLTSNISFQFVAGAKLLPQL